MTRVKELEDQVANLTAECAAAKKESTATTRRADEAVRKEKDALKQATELEEALTPRLESVVNSLSGNLIFLLILCSFAALFCYLFEVPESFLQRSWAVLPSWRPGFGRVLSLMISPPLKSKC